MSGNPLKVEIEECDQIKIVHLSGPLDSMTHDQLREQLEALFLRARARVVLDCEHLTYANSRGLTLLIHFYRISAVHLSFLGIAALNPRIIKSVELLGMDRLVPLYDTVAAALAAAARL